jgi:prevent-host-death family protein
MNSEYIGAFDAKTHFSQLLREVEKGKEFHVTLRGKPVAVIKRDDEYAKPTKHHALTRLAKYRSPITIEEIEALRDDGRER